MSIRLNHNKIGELDTLIVTGEGYRAAVLLQGAQLIHFLTQSEVEHEFTDNLCDNWLWVSEHAIYQQGVSVRGGVPLCWPVFGQFDANPQAVKDSFTDCCYDLSQHGYARTQLFELDSFQSLASYHTDSGHLGSGSASQLILKLKQTDGHHDMTHVDLKVEFIFSAEGFAIKLITQNNSEQTLTFSQALHTYLPTDDIAQTSITGFDGVTYSDTLTTDATGDWQTKTQQGDITFNGEVDRIYHDAPDIALNTPAHSYQLQAQASNSTVVWNPWIEKSKTISQFAEDDYQRMLCIETANAHLDVVELDAGEVWEMGLSITRN